MNIIDLAELRVLPDWAIRWGIRQLLARRVRAQRLLSANQLRAAKAAFIHDIRRGPLAEATGAANEQHYEVPATFFRLMLGPRLKYSCCWFEAEQSHLAVAEESMLQLTCERAALADGQRVLELGCGWGSLTLWMAEQFPHSQITAISNSHSQREFIAARARQAELKNIRLITADMRDFAIDGQFDRIVSVEMFEHMRNYELLLARLAQWVAPDGRLFVHIFCHRDSPYLFEAEGAINWMGRHFFTGGMMPSADLLSHFGEHFAVEQNWQNNGEHYARTCDAWLRRLDTNSGAALDIFREPSNLTQARRAVQRWRMFLMACAELFRYSAGSEWFVGHYLLAPAHCDARKPTLQRATAGA
jgi:cyclopropane-fatty-acyl-phospholipid synthase